MFYNNNIVVIIVMIDVVNNWLNCKINTERSIK